MLLPTKWAKLPAMRTSMSRVRKEVGTWEEVPIHFFDKILLMHSRYARLHLFVFKAMPPGWRKGGRVLLLPEVCNPSRDDLPKAHEILPSSLFLDSSL